MDLPGAKRVTVIPTGAALGADIAGLDLSRPLDEKTFKAVESAWHQHLVLRFRGQKLDDPGLLAFARLFGVAPETAAGHARQTGGRRFGPLERAGEFREGRSGPSAFY